MFSEEYRTGSVLIVDDNNELLNVMEEFLHNEFEGNLLTANSPQKALQVCYENQIDLALIDIKMPGINGIELLQELKKINPSLGCIFISGLIDEETILEAYKNGALEFISKPFNPEDLIKLIQSTLKKIRGEKTYGHLPNVQRDHKAQIVS